MKLTERLKKISKGIGPGVITGASDDDPSGILTYLQGGFMFGFKTLWLTVFCFPLMYALQEMSARIGYVTGKGLVRIFKDYYPRWILYLVVLVSAAVITTNIGANLLALGVILERLTLISRFFWIPAGAVFILFFTIFFSYPKFASFMKWLVISLFFYVAVVFYLGIDWFEALKSTFIPHFSFEKEFLIIFCAFLGTTISPYLFFWQADEEVEERVEQKKERRLKRFLVTKNELKHLKEDTFWGMFFSQLISWFIIVSSGYMAITYGSKEIVNFDQAAEVLKPLLGDYSFFFFSIGILGSTFIAVPVLAGSIGYALSEVFGWEEGINKTFREAKGFYGIIIAACFLGVIMNFSNFDPIKLLIYTAVLYTIITPLLVFMILKIANNKKIMKEKTNSFLSNFFGWITFLVTLVTTIFVVWGFFN
jgi:NRAMP (natural resistance-associated macrophage protein)-like metal ion transporter